MQIVSQQVQACRDEANLPVTAKRLEKVVAQRVNRQERFRLVRPLMKRYSISQSRETLRHMLSGRRAAASSIVQRAIAQSRKGSSRPVASAGSSGDVRLGTSRPLPKVQGSGRPKGTALAGIAFGGNFRDHVGRRATRRQVNEATAQVAAARFVRAQQPIAGKQIKGKDRR